MMENLKSQWQEAKHHRTFMVGLFIIASIVFIVLFADRLAPNSYRAINLNQSLLPPSIQFPFGTDNYGRCIFSRVLYGTRIAFRVGIIVVVIETTIGVTLGLIAGFYGKILDRVILFITDLTWALPPIIMALAIVTMLGPSLNNVIIAIAVVSWAQFTRIVRVKTQAIKNMPFIEAAKAFGESNFSIMTRYILPNVLSPIIVLSTLALPAAILSTTALGFLGLGAQPPEPDWGLILKDGINYMKMAPWISIFPGLAIVYTVLGFNLLGEGLRDLIDPRMKV
jgi:peptide/nickel transport system permease protein